MSFGEHRIYDALIAGAGPAGAHLGYLLAAQGLRVAIIDKESFPREKVCGGGLSKKSVDLLGLDLGSVVHRSIDSAILTYRNGDSLIKEMDTAVGCTVVRGEFDELLLARARAHGADFLAQTAFIDAGESADWLDVNTSGGVLRCRLLFAADGAASAVRARIFGKETVACVPALEAIIRPGDDALARFGRRVLFDFGAMPRGYGWIFPKHDHFNVGVYSPFGGVSLRRNLDRFIARYACLRRPVDVDYRGYIIPIRNRRKLFQRGRVWLLGDAAGLAEALFGEGIYFALKSAALAAAVVGEEGLRADSDRYSRLLRRELLPELRAAEWMARLVFRFPRLAFSHLVLNQRINRHFAGLISGEMGYRRCLAKTLAGFPRWLLPSRPAGRLPQL